MLSLSGRSDREVTVKGWSNITGLDWAADGKSLYCGSVSAQGITLLHVDLHGNARVLWQSNAQLNVRRFGVFARLTVGGNAIWGIPSPDGRFLAIRGEVRNSNVWMLEGF
jgi:hypothetical protein